MTTESSAVRTRVSSSLPMPLSATLCVSFSGVAMLMASFARAADATGVAARMRSEPVRLLGWIIAGLAVPGAAATALAGDRAALGGWLVLVGVGLLGTRERRSAAELEATRVGAALRAAFERPEPPEND